MNLRDEIFIGASRNKTTDADRVNKIVNDGSCSIDASRAHESLPKNVANDQAQPVLENATVKNFSLSNSKESCMNKTNQMPPFDIEEVGSGFTVADYSGGRGIHGAAYADRDGVWHDQPVSVRAPFVSAEAAREWAQKQSYA